ncbi:MAG: hypothetical protein KJ893_05625 [Candidatus Omnitrophica bacterium]|nr:hypothetical protein [Candidatus Omnitrophota bacterium]MBU4478523.1 hypothetical protein [Candidatus Omnitrophota bacterium]MCG2702939.1 asparagine synthase-related protein [Candidatus Omnitrophota bacterium]
MENKLRIKLEDSVSRNRAEGMLFSGGLDTSILAALCPEVRAINVSLEDFSTDLEYARAVEEALGLKVHYLSVTTEEALAALPEIIKILKSFDPAVPNDVTVYFGLKYAKKLGLNSMMTGDGSDELLGGYDFMRNRGDLEDYIRYLSRKMFFSSNLLGDFFQLAIKQPYIDKEFADFAVNEVPVKSKICEHNGRVWGKCVLRKAFEGVLADEIIWQSKRPLEFGSGTTRLREIISGKISDKEYAGKQKKYPVKFINKEHLYFYEIYMDVVGRIPLPQPGQEACPGCGAGMKKAACHCRVCGWVKI